MLVKEKNYKLINRNLFSLKVGILIPIIIINNFNQIPKRRLSSENDGPLFQQTRQRYSIKRCSVFCCSLQSRRTTALSFSTSLKLKQRKMFLTSFHKKLLRDSSEAFLVLNFFANDYGNAAAPFHRSSFHRLPFLCNQGGFLIAMTPILILPTVSLKIVINQLSISKMKF